MHIARMHDERRITIISPARTMGIIYRYDKIVPMCCIIINMVGKIAGELHTCKCYKYGHTSSFVVFVAQYQKHCER